MVQAGFLQVYRFGNILHGGAVEPFLAKDLRRGFKDVFSCHWLSLPNGRLMNNTVAGMACQG